MTTSSCQLGLKYADFSYGKKKKKKKSASSYATKKDVY